jgi:hypothetical protein
MARTQLTALSADQVGAVFLHPEHQLNVDAVIELISQLQQAETPADLHILQRSLLARLLHVEGLRASCSRVLKRLRARQSLPADHPQLAEDVDPHAVETWQFQILVYERLARQLRSVGDGLAWRCYGFDRRAILTLSRNPSPGMMHGKAGLDQELASVEESWQSGHFALLHDLTNCLRIADLSIFRNGQIVLQEVKSNPQRIDRRQLERINRAIDALMDGGPLPGRERAGLVDVTEPYVTNLCQLADIVALARRHGSRGMRLTHGRAIVVAYLPELLSRWHHDPEGGLKSLASTRARALRRAGIANATSVLCGRSVDSASRSPIAPPWSIYPLSAEDCAALTCDLLLFESYLALDQLVDLLEATGLRTDVLLGIGEESDILKLQLGSKVMIVHTPGLGPLLFELTDPAAWARGMADALRASSQLGEPVVAFADEPATWRRR